MKERENQKKDIIQKLHIAACQKGSLMLINANSEQTYKNTDKAN